MFKKKNWEDNPVPPIYDVRDIACTLINEAISRGKPLNNVRAMKLLFYVQALAISRLKRIAFNDEFVAWTYGPAITTAWDYLKFFSHHNIEEPVTERLDVEFFSSREVCIEARVVKTSINNEMIDDELLQVVHDVILKAHAASTMELIKYSMSEVLWKNVAIKDTMKMEDMIEYFLNTSEEKILNIAPKKLDNQL